MDEPEITLPVDTVEGWAAAYVRTDDLTSKLSPALPPDRWLPAPPPPLRIESPGRPPELEIVDKTPRSPRRDKMHNPRARARLLCTFLHHELQAAELMCWAILAFPATPEEFRRGLLGICQDEIRHMGMYRAHIERLGHRVGEFPVRDWFWQRVAQCQTPLQFVALMGIGLEGSNLDHTERFAGWFRDVGDEQGARLQEVVGDEEVAHVQFALHWFQTWTEGQEFDRWCEELVAPLTPTMMKGPELCDARRREAGFSDEFLQRLRDWSA